MVTWDALDALSHALELSGVGPASSVVALIGHDDELVPLVRAALARSRAEALEVRPIRADATELTRLRHGTLLRSLISEAEIVIDALEHSSTDAQLLIDDLDGPTRVLRLLPAAAHAQIRPPHANLAHRVEALGDLLSRGGELRVSDMHGGELVVDLADAQISGDGGRTNRSGQVATYPAGWVQVVPGLARVHGDVVLMPGDANLGRAAHISSPIRLTIRNDLIAEIDGDSADADVLRALFEQLDNPDVYGVASVCIGMNPGRELSGDPFDPVLIDDDLARLTAGVVRLAFGDNDLADRPCAATIALALSRRTVQVDNVPVCRDGELVGEVAPDIYELPD